MANPICTTKELASIKNGGQYILTSDISITGTFTPLTSSNVTLDGAGYTIRGLKTPLFTLLTFGTVKNLTISTAIDDFMGGALAERLEDCTITAVKSTGSVKTAQAGGGLACQAVRCTITDCRNEASIVGASQAGGLVGEFMNARMSGCTNTGDVFSTGMSGGIVALSRSSTITSSYQEATIDGNAAGGIAGYAYDSTIASCTVCGTLYADERAGGVAGAASDDSILSDNMVFSGIIAAGNVGRVVAYMAGDEQTLNGNLADPAVRLTGRAGSLVYNEKAVQQSDPGYGAGRLHGEDLLCRQGQTLVHCKGCIDNTASSTSSGSVSSVRGRKVCLSCGQRPEGTPKRKKKRYRRD